MPWWREWLSTPVSLLRRFHAHWSLEGYSPGGRKELGITEGLTRSCFSGITIPKKGEASDIIFRGKFKAKMSKMFS